MGAVEHTPAEVAVKAIEGTVTVAVAAPAALTYHHAGLGSYGLGAYGAYGAYPYAAAYRGLAGLAVAPSAVAGLAPSDPTNPTAVHTSRLGICVNYLGAQVPC